MTTTLEQYTSPEFQAMRRIADARILDCGHAESRHVRSTPRE